MTVGKEKYKAWIKDMGYVIATPIKLKPSYYKLKDGTIIKALIYVNHLTPAADGQGGTISATNIIAAHVPRKKRHPADYQPHRPNDPPAEIINDNMEMEVLQEDFSTYDLSDGTIFSVKTTVGQIIKSDHVTLDGEHVYDARLVPVTKTEKK